MDFGKKYFNGNFSVLKLKRGDESVIRVQAVSGNFAVEYGAETMMFLLIDNMDWCDGSVATEDMRVLSVMLTNVYCVGAMLDAKLHKDVLVAIDSALKRIEPSEVTEDSEKEDIEAVKMAIKVKEDVASMGDDVTDDSGMV